MTLLEELYRRGLQQQQVAPDLYAGDGLLMFWSHEPIAPWQDEKWLAQMRRTLRPNQYLRMIENCFVTTEFELHVVGGVGPLCRSEFASVVRRAWAAGLCRR